MRDFPAQQARARRRTRWLIALYAAMLPAVAALGAASLMAAAAIGLLLERDAKNGESGNLELIAAALGSPWMPRVLAIATLLIAAVMAFASAWRWLELRKGGSWLAESVGARRIGPDSTVPEERRLLNVAEEMAIASRMPVPPVYVLEQPRAINAFAAGCTTDDAVVVVTRGLLRAMDRDQLQGVVAHEFSHILNGDMRLNVVLISLVHGIAAVGVMGEVLLHSSSSRDRSNYGAVAGLALKTIGFFGAAAGSILQAAVSREREYLADASAVEFTRHPQGLAGALKIIGGFGAKGQLPPKVSLQCNHMCIVEAKVSAMLRSHPPLEERVRRLEPGWNGAFERFDFPVSPEESALAALAALSRPVRPIDEGALALVPPGPASAALVASAEPAHAAGWSPMDVLKRVEAARVTISAIRPAMLEAARTLFDAEALVLAMLLSRRDEVASSQGRLITAALGEAAAGRAAALRESLAAEPRAIRMPLLLVALGTLGGVSQAQYDAFRKLMEGMIEANPRTDLFKLCVHKSATARLDRRMGRPRPAAAYYSLAKLGPQCSTLLSAVAAAGGLKDFGDALQRAGSRLGVVTLSPVPASELSASTISAALDLLSTASSPHRWRLVEACATLAGSDHALTDSEHELLGAIADALHVPTAADRPR